MAQEQNELVTTAEPVEEEANTISIEEEFRDLYASGEEIKERLGKLLKQYEGSGSDRQVRGNDLAVLYGFVQGDVLSLLQDLINATGAAVNELLDTGEEEPGDEDEDDEDDGVDDFTIQVYATLQANAQVFSTLKEADSIPEEQRKGFSELFLMNENTMGLIREQVGDEVVQRAAEWLEAAKQQATQEQEVSSDG